MSPPPFQSPLEPAPTFAEISAFSRRQAMDWSLALASQGIESTILRSVERQRWILQVAPPDFERAMETIRLYRAENRGWSLRRTLAGEDIDLHWGAIAFCVVLGLVHSFGTYQVPAVHAKGALDSILVHQGQWWRIFTAIYLHQDLAHLAANVTFGMVVLGLAMGRFGAGISLLATFLAGAIGNLFGLRFYSHPYIGVGASGMMMGALGMIAVHSMYLWRTNPRATRVIFSSVAAGLLLFILFGTNVTSDVLAHLGGFIAGLIFGGIVAIAPPKWVRQRIIDRIALILFVTLSLFVWILALR
jgi:membrane associated rhomboid family serine protease